MWHVYNTVDHFNIRCKVQNIILMKLNVIVHWKELKWRSSFTAVPLPDGQRKINPKCGIFLTLSDPIFRLFDLGTRFPIVCSTLQNPFTNRCSSIFRIFKNQLKLKIIFSSERFVAFHFKMWITSRIAGSFLFYRIT